jgi:hypothetical protein
MLVAASSRDPVHFWLVVLRYPLMLVGGVVAETVRRWHKRRRDEIAEGWPSVEGCVQFVSVDPVSSTDYFKATLEYSYFVGEYRSGKYTQNFDSEDCANAFVQPMKEKKVQVRYNPANPDKSLLDESFIQQLIPLTSTSTLSVS